MHYRSGNGIVSYYFNLVLEGIGITSQGQKTLLNGLLQLYNLATAYFGALMVDRLGRRFLFLISGIGMCISYLCWTIASAMYAKTKDTDPNVAAGRTVLACIFFYYLFYNLAMSPLLVSYTVEILPFRVRAKGLMVMNLCVNAALVFNQYSNPIALKALDWKYYIVYTCWLAFEVVYMYFYVVETKGKNGPLSLEEIAALFDGPGAQQDIMAAGQTKGYATEAIEHDSKKEDFENVEQVHSLRA
jgi:MFS family permease